MKILIYTLNYFPELTGIGKYNGEMAEWLARQGHSVRVICANPYYPEWRINKEYNKWFFKREIINNVIIYRTPIYVPSNVRFFRRLLHLFSFSLLSIIPLFRILPWQPNLFIAIMPSLFSLPSALFFSKLYHSKSWLHVQDLEIDAMFNLSIINKSRFIKKRKIMYSHSR